MSEKITPQHHESLKRIDTAAEHLGAPRKSPEQQAEKQEANKITVEQAAHNVEQHAISGKELVHNEEARDNPHPVLVNKQLKDMAYSRTMVRVRKKLSSPSRVFSKITHSKVLDRPSEVIGNSVARPSSMLGGAIAAAFGTFLLLWVTKRYGYEYNYLAVVLLFAVGMSIGLLVEFAFKQFKKH